MEHYVDLFMAALASLILSGLIIGWTDLGTTHFV